MILKVLLVIIVIAIVYFIIVKKKPTIQNSNNEGKKKSETQSSEMVECSTCKVYCELNEAILSGSKYYCSKECLEGR